MAYAVATQPVRADDLEAARTQFVTSCGTCHSGLFPGVSRNRFDVHNFPDKLSATERETVLWRIRRPSHDLKRMPPAQFSDLTEQQIESIETALMRPR